MVLNLERFKKIYLLVCWLVLIAKLLTMPIAGGAGFDFAYDDKLIHLVLFGGLVYFLVEVIESFYLLRYVYVVFLSFVFSIVYAQSLEAIQTFVPGRTVSFYDTIAGGLGALIAAISIYYLDYRKSRKPKLLLHMCCIGCGVAVIERLAADYEVVLFFYNPNIHPLSEYAKRLEEIKKIAHRHHLKVIIKKYNHGEWLKKIRGHEQEPERGGRCVICYRDRLLETARRAKSLGYDYFTSTLSISPHKSFEVIKQIGQELEKQQGVKFLAEDFKKNNGFQRSCELSKSLELYRQDYCGCEFSIRKK